MKGRNRDANIGDSCVDRWGEEGGNLMNSTGLSWVLGGGLGGWDGGGRRES